MDDPYDFYWPTKWVHCSPAALAAGVNCTWTPRRACVCSDIPAGSHDHLISVPGYCVPILGVHANPHRQCRLRAQ